MRFLSTVVLLALTSAAQAQTKEVIRVPGMLEGLPFSSAIRVGDMLYLSGQIGIDPATNQLVPGGVAAQTRQTMDNIQNVVEHAGSSMDRVVKCTVFFADMADYQAVNAVYAEYFPTDPPARSAFGASGLAFGALVEIECMALAAPR